MSKKQQYTGIESLFPLLGGDPRCDYRFGMFTTENSQECFFRLSFITQSKHAASGIEPELIIVVDRECADKSTGERIIEEKQYVFPGSKDVDDGKQSWLFPINDTQMQELADADCIKSIMIFKHHKCVVDLYSAGQEFWSLFFRAGVAECINEEQDSWELTDFCIQYYLTRRKLEIEAIIDTKAVKASGLACEIGKPDGDMENLLK